MRKFFLFKRYSDGSWRKIAETTAETWLDAEIYFDEHVDGRIIKPSLYGITYIIAEAFERYEGKLEGIVHLYRDFPLHPSHSIMFYEYELREILEIVEKIKENGGDDR